VEVGVPESGPERGPEKGGRAAPESQVSSYISTDLWNRNLVSQGVCLGVQK